MRVITPSVQILMEPGYRLAHKPEAQRERSPIVAFKSRENLVATRGLWNHLNILHRGVQKSTSSQEAPLRVVFDFLSNDLDQFRLEAVNSVIALSKPDRHRAYFAPVIAYTLFGHEARQTGEWLEHRSKEERLMQLFHKVMQMDDEQTEVNRHWAHRNNTLRRTFYLDELEKIRSHPVVTDLVRAIEESDHSLSQDTPKGVE